MSQLVSRILLTIVMFPLASLVYLVVAVSGHRAFRGATYVEQEIYTFSFSGLVTWAFIATWWYLLWRDSVRWTQVRVARTLLAIIGAVVAGVFLGFFTGGIEQEIGAFVGSVAAPVLWLVMTVFIWRESNAERGARLAHLGKEAVMCAQCGYNMTGLKEARCPECGKQYTIDELFAAQGAAKAAEVEE